MKAFIFSLGLVAAQALQFNLKEHNAAIKSELVKAELALAAGRYPEVIEALELNIANEASLSEPAERFLW